MQKKSARETIEDMIQKLEAYLKDLDEIGSDDENYLFVCGERSVYRQCLEILLAGRAEADREDEEENSSKKRTSKKSKQG